MSKVSINRYVVQAKLLGEEDASCKNKRQEYAIAVTLSDESHYTIYRSLEAIAKFQKTLLKQFPIEAGYFNEHERIIPDCPIKKTIFGVQRIQKNDSTFERHLKTYIKALPALPSRLVKSKDFISFFALHSCDMMLPAEKKKNKKELNQCSFTSDGEISNPICLKACYCITDFKSSQNNGQRLSLKSGSVVHIVQKDKSGWWLVECSGTLGWAPASYLIPVDEDDETGDSDDLFQSEKVGKRFISTTSYEACYDDELSFDAGAIVRLIRESENGWWFVHYNGREGFVPGTLFKTFDKRQASVYVERIKLSINRRRSTCVPGTIQYNERRGSSHEIMLYECMAKFVGQADQYQISLRRGASVTVIEKKESGWWYVQDEHGRVGWAPASHLKVIFDDSIADEDQDEFDSVDHGLYKVLHSYESQLHNQRQSFMSGDIVTVINKVDKRHWRVKRIMDPSQEGVIPPSFLISCDGHQEDPATSIASDGENKMTTDECYEVIADYIKQSVNELTVYEGEVVCVIDNSDENDWYVSTDEQEGWLPASILQPLNDLDKSSCESDDEFKTTDNNKHNEPKNSGSSISICALKFQDEAHES
ncbi:PREDICTED: neutrophil cytosol factor 1-like isoform X1 [Amphimedon queenslandica]|uniref:SH3 and PX domain-containing protein 2A n=1 Tax=Amphimedon queenslandica TaxID=400682 RepID=A0AAN0IQV3_AMPQE|nr:PREDICTED: neutrophil cytosol factor 1-like isoform X1 [Amphimedon queenslandica]|eukprot:XP_011406585.1 PREDICTED: neutrophil cytosol factor 1-like isoform X1 [Amphimedon queenslandica]